MQQKIEQSIFNLLSSQEDVIQIFLGKITNNVSVISQILKGESQNISKQVAEQIKTFIDYAKEKKQQIFENPIIKSIEEFLNQLSTFIEKAEMTIYSILDQNLFPEDKNDNAILKIFKESAREVIQAAISKIINEPLSSIFHTINSLINNTQESLAQILQEQESLIDSQINLLENQLQQIIKNNSDNKYHDQQQTQIADEIQNIQESFKEAISDFLQSLDPKNIFSGVIEEFEKLTHLIREELPSSLKELQEYFMSFFNNFTVELKEVLSTLKEKSKTFARDLIEAIKSKIKETMDEFSKIKALTENSLKNLVSFMKVSFSNKEIVVNIQFLFNQQNFIEHILSQIEDNGEEDEEEKEKMKDDNTSDQPSPFLSIESLFKSDLKMFAQKIKELSVVGIGQIKNTVKRIENIPDIFKRFSIDSIEIFKNPFTSLDLMKIDVQSSYDDSEVFNTSILTDLFKDLISALKEDFDQFAQIEIVSEIKEKGIKLFQDEFNNLSQKLVKQMTDDVSKNLLNSNQLLESAIVNISKLFETQSEKKLLIKNSIVLPQTSIPILIPTPIGIFIQLDYGFNLNYQINAYYSLKGLSVNANFNADIESSIFASASLSILIAKAGVLARGQLINASLDSQLNFEILPKLTGNFQLNARFNALSLSVVTFFQYIYVDIELKCIKIFRRNLRSSVFANELNMVVHFDKKKPKRILFFRAIKRFFKKIVRIVTRIVKGIFNGEICLPYITFKYSDEIPIFPPFKSEGIKFEKQLINIKI